MRKLSASLIVTAIAGFMVFATSIPASATPIIKVPTVPPSQVSTVQTIGDTIYQGFDNLLRPIRVLTDQTVYGVAPMLTDGWNFLQEFTDPYVQDQQEVFCDAVARGKATENPDQGFRCGDLEGYGNSGGAVLSVGKVKAQNLYVESGTSIGTYNPCRVSGGPSNSYAWPLTTASSLYTAGGGYCSTVSFSTFNLEFGRATFSNSDRTMTIPYTCTGTSCSNLGGGSSWVPPWWISTCRNNTTGVLTSVSYSSVNNTTTTGGRFALGSSTKTFTCAVGSSAVQMTLIGSQFTFPSHPNDVGVYVMDTKGFTPAPDGSVPGVLRTTLTCIDGGTSTETTVVDDQSINLQPGHVAPYDGAECISGTAVKAATMLWIPTTGSNVNIANKSFWDVFWAAWNVVWTTWDCFWSGDCADNNEGAGGTEPGKPAGAACMTPETWTPDCKQELKEVCGDDPSNPCKTDQPPESTCIQNAQFCQDWVDGVKEGAKQYKCEFAGREVPLDVCGTQKDPVNGPTANTENDGTKIPYTDPPTGPGGGDTGDQGAGCSPPSWTDYWGNPITGTAEAVGCAIETMFVPDPNKLQEGFEGMHDAWSQTPMGQIQEWLDGIVLEMPESTGCKGPHISFTLPLSEISDFDDMVISEYPLSVCEDAEINLSVYAAAVKLVSTIVFIVGGVTVIVRQIAAVISFPGLDGKA